MEELKIYLIGSFYFDLICLGLLLLWLGWFLAYDLITTTWRDWRNRSWKRIARENPPKGKNGRL